MIECLKQENWLSVVYNGASCSEIHRLQNPVAMPWGSVVRIEPYHLEVDMIKPRSEKC
ncbi:MAG: hypothetical protein OZSIB_0168 [Candidatus Ozemobacter sibiricus]|uniref:Uncharacterized protein n=1 Tax=Candidatus Ozemobacter sibiricus TaxID=2268124 RepID=A0A367ZN54_9BACT|nr:MAG: hypothetical protein OZSIB_0168 [Candidatus Ozemobacter sibiricus]